MKEVLLVKDVIESIGNGLQVPKGFRHLYHAGAESLIERRTSRNRIIVWSLPDANKLFSMGYYGKPVGIPKPKFGEIDAPLVLDLMEGIYLLDKKIISIYAEKKKQNMKICSRYAEMNITSLIKNMQCMSILERKIT